MNILSMLLGKGDSTRLSAADYKSRFVEAKLTHQLIDVRSPDEFTEGHIAGALNFPLPDLDRQLGKIKRDQPVMLYCRSGNRSGMALQKLRSAGFTELYNLGGIGELTAQGLPQKKGKGAR